VVRLLVNSQGISIVALVRDLIQLKVTETVLFFERIGARPFDQHALELLMQSQFYFFRQLLESGYEKEEAASCMKTVQDFMASGWKQLFEQLTDADTMRVDP